MKLPDGQPLTWRSLQVSGSIILYARTFNIIACDAGTRAFLIKNHQAVAADQNFPEGPFEKAQRVGRINWARHC
jgi:hypothetical protein